MEALTLSAQGVCEDWTTVEEAKKENVSTVRSPTTTSPALQAEATVRATWMDWVVEQFEGGFVT